MKTSLAASLALLFALVSSCLSGGGTDAGVAGDSSPASDDAGSSATGELCVAGTASACPFAANARWDGATCCVTGATQCTTGTASACGDAADESWTGSACCIRSEAFCTAGTATQCGDSARETWTGAVCCVRGATQCNTSSASGCAASGGAWTGSVCCD